MPAFDIEEFIHGEDQNAIVNGLQQRRLCSLPNLKKLKKQWDPYKHEVFNSTKRKNKQKKVVDEKSGEETIIYQPVNRMAFPFQKLIVNKAVSFLFGNSVEFKCSPTNDNEKIVLQALKRIQYETKEKSFNRQIARDMFRGQEIAEYWYINELDEESNSYGFATKMQLKCGFVSAWKEDVLYPFFDTKGDLLAFSRQYSTLSIDFKNIECFEVFTKDSHIVWVMTNGKWEVSEDDSETFDFNKMPVVWGRQEEVEWYDVQISIERLETLLSNYGDIIDYNANPIFYAEGEIESIADKDETGRILQGETGAKAYYVSWDQAPDAIKLEIETLLRFIYSFTQTPDISFDSVKGLQAISGQALKLLFMDAHLKVQDKLEIYELYLQRRINIQLAMLAYINKSLKEACKTIHIEPVIKPYMINDPTQWIDDLIKANGGKAIISQ